MNGELNRIMDDEERVAVAHALEQVKAHAQWCRENGESDMRNVIHFINGTVTAVEQKGVVEEYKAIEE